MVRVDLALNSVDELPIAALKLTKFNEHFAIGYRLNHVFFDQSAIVYFFEYISHLYSKMDQPKTEYLIKHNFDIHVEATIQAPKFEPRVQLVSEGMAFRDKEEFMACSPKSYSTEPLNLTFVLPKRITLRFQNHQIQKLKQCDRNQQTFISTNDIIHAILLKAHATAVRVMHENNNHTSATTDSVRLLFARNMRGIFDKGTEVVGDYVRLEEVRMQRAAIDESSLLELAQLNRLNLVSKQNDEKLQLLKETYIRECLWFRDFHMFADGRPSNDFLNDSDAVVVTNWSSFPYDRIRFDNVAEGCSAKVQSLILEEAPMMTTTGAFAIISFQQVNEIERDTICQINTPYEEVLHAIKGLQVESELFDIINN